VAAGFANEGVDVAIADLDEHDDATRTAALVESTGRRCLRFPGDLADADSFSPSSPKRPLRWADWTFWSTMWRTRIRPRNSPILQTTSGGGRSRSIGSFFSGDQGCPRGYARRRGHHHG